MDWMPGTGDLCLRIGMSFSSSCERRKRCASGGAGRLCRSACSGLRTRGSACSIRRRLMMVGELETDPSALALGESRCFVRNMAKQICVRLRGVALATHYYK